VTLRN